jgi:hypothetical protein
LGIGPPGGIGDPGLLGSDGSLRSSSGLSDFSGSSASSNSSSKGSGFLCGSDGPGSNSFNFPCVINVRVAFVSSCFHSMSLTQVT